MSRVFLNINQTAGPIESSPLVEGDANYERREEKKYKFNPTHGIKTPTTEAELRVQLAAAYRAVARLGWDDGIQNHLTVRVPGERNQFLINSYGQGFEEVTAASLVKIDHEGNVLEEGSMGSTVNFAGFAIHSAIHQAREDAICVMHTHEKNVIALASMKCGFLPLSQTHLLAGEVTSHPYGPAATVPECREMATSMGNSDILLLKNHGVLTTGRTIAEAFTRLWYITRAAEIQVQAMASPHAMEAVELIDDETVEYYKGTKFIKIVADSEFAHQVRLVDRDLPGYDDINKPAKNKMKQEKKKKKKKGKKKKKMKNKN